MDLFKQRLLAEGVRSIEADLPALTATVAGAKDKSFETLLLDRAQQLDSSLHISALFAHFQTLTTNLFRALAIALLIIGGLSVKQFFFSVEGAQINFFWVFTLFFIPNIITLFLWLLFFFQYRGLPQGWLIRSCIYICRRIEQRFNYKASQSEHFWPLFQCYFEVFFSDKLGRYQLSSLTHRLWFSYFFGASIMLVIMLATHQVDFIWQTSILSVANLQWLTDLLAYIPNLLGILVPNVEQIQHSHLGALNVLADEQASRLAWSTLLISSFIIYGLLPRLLLWGLMSLLFKRNKQAFRLDFSRSYYVQLRQLLKPNVTSLGISDPDMQGSRPFIAVDARISIGALPTFFYPIALELSESQFAICQQHVRQHCPEQLVHLQNVCDFSGQQSMLSNLTTANVSAIVVYVSLLHLPDRGVLRLLCSLNTLNANQLYLLLIDENRQSQQNREKRRSDWYSAAAQANISLDNIVQFQCNSSGDA